MSDIYCVWCHDVICELPHDVWPPKYKGKRIFLDQRRWDQRLFHTIFDHHSKEIVAVHYECKEEYYQETFSGGHEFPAALLQYHCPSCGELFSKKEFYVTARLQVMHRGCCPRPCGWCYKTIGRLPMVTLSQDYSFHAICAAKFCSKPLKMAFDTPGLVADIDMFWPNRLTKLTACLYPPEFRATIRGLLMAIKHLQLKYRVPTDIVLLIMNLAVSPMSYPVQNGLEISKLPTLLGGSCDKCKKPMALTRFDKGYCAPGDCLIFSDKQCPRRHFVKFNVSRPEDCTEYRCGEDRFCRVCTGFIRYTSTTPINWCQIYQCTVKWSEECDCGRSCFKHLDSNAQPIKLDTHQCFMGACRYIIADKRCSCGEALYQTSPSPYVCTLDGCKMYVRRMVDEAMRFIGATRAKGHLFSHAN